MLFEDILKSRTGEYSHANLRLLYKMLDVFHDYKYPVFFLDLQVHKCWDLVEARQTHGRKDKSRPLENSWKYPCHDLVNPQHARYPGKEKNRVLTPEQKEAALKLAGVQEKKDDGKTKNPAYMKSVCKITTGPETANKGQDEMGPTRNELKHSTCEFDDAVIDGLVDYFRTTCRLHVQRISNDDRGETYSMPLDDRRHVWTEMKKLDLDGTNTFGRFRARIFKMTHEPGYDKAERFPNIPKPPSSSQDSQATSDP